MRALRFGICLSVAAALLIIACGSSAPAHCVGSAIVCPSSGWWCGNNGVTNSNANSLYYCNSAGVPLVAILCPNGCHPNPIGTPDGCTSGTGNITCPGSGRDCGNDGVTNGVATTLYICQGSGQAAPSYIPCPNGCQVNSTGVPDVCNSPASPSCPGTGIYCASDGVTGGDPNTLYTCPGSGQAPTSFSMCSGGCKH